ncbi:MAG: sugar phosphate isomerase/epimerase [Tannerella sp.]|jgi:sugar phosphate isomerase/epimerase|nr:sugar phosphate isomerase/epimerase [Tannerella sp.]
MQSRRDFIKRASMLVAGGVVVPNLLSSCGGSATKSSKYLGLQLYSLREMVNDEGIQKVLETVAKMGYTSLETAGYSDGKFYGMAPAKLKKMANSLGMKLTSSHLGRNISGDRDADMAWWNKAVEAHNAAGMKYMVMPSSPLSGEGATLDNIKRYGDYFNEIGLITAGASIQFGYHNHAFEFENKVDGVPVYDLMLENTSPNHVMFQLDVYWIKKGGYDPVDYMKKYPKRIKVLHIKDETAIGAQNTVDYKAVFDQAYANGVKDWYVEVENYDTTPEEDVKKSADFLLAADFVK